MPAVAARAKAAKPRPTYASQISHLPVDEVTEAIDPNRPLTPKARAFAKYWASGESVVTAAARAGLVGHQYAYRLARYPQVIALYEREKAKYEEAAQMTRKRVMDGLLEGVEMGKLQSDPMAVISGWREIGKMCGYYEPVKRTLDINVSGNIAMDRMNRLSDAELLRLITAGIQSEPELIEGDDADEGDD